MTGYISQQLQVSEEQVSESMFLVLILACIDKCTRLVAKENLEIFTIGFVDHQNTFLENILRLGVYILFQHTFPRMEASLNLPNSASTT